MYYHLGVKRREFGLFLPIQLRKQANNILCLLSCAWRMVQHTGAHGAIVRADSCAGAHRPVSHARNL